MNAPHAFATGNGPKPRLLDQVRATIRVKRYSPRTEDAYIGWIKRFPVVPAREEVESVLMLLNGKLWLLQDGYDIRTVQELLGHQDIETTMINTHVLKRGGRGVRSPLDRP